MFRHDIREKPVLYKEILKAISKRELLEDLCSFLTRVRHERLFAIGKRSLSPWANTIALCALLPSDQPTTVDCPSDKLTNFNHPFMN